MNDVMFDNSTIGTEEAVKPTSYRIAEGMWTNPEQTTAVDLMLDFLCNSDDKEFTLVGKAGVGKTTVVNVVVEMLRGRRKFNKDRQAYENFRVSASAPSHSACNVLSKALKYKVKVYTIASILGMKLNIDTGKFTVDEFSRRENGVPIEDCNVVIFDECSMIGENLMKYIRDFSDKQTKIIYMGDFRQLPPIREKGENPDMEADSPTFKVKNTFSLKTRMRQGEESPLIPIIDAIGDNIENKILKRIEPELRQSKTIGSSVLTFTSDGPRTLSDMSDCFLENPQDPLHVKGIAYTNDYRKLVNESIRKRLYTNECHNQFVIGEIVTAFDTFYMNEITRIDNSESFFVTSISEGEVDYSYTEFTSEGEFNMKPKLVDVRIRVLFLDLRSVDQHFYGVPVVRREDQGKFAAIRSDMYNKGLRKESYKFKEMFADIQHGYVITSHKAQGNTYNKCYIMEDNILNNPILAKVSYLTRLKSMYVGASRPRNELTIFSRVL